MIGLMHKLKSLVSKKNLFFALLLLLVIIASVLAFYFYNKSQKPQNPTTLAQQEVTDLVVTVGKLIELPKGENPTVATVSDKTKLLDQPFFKNAQNGDKVLIYSKAQKAILYRPSINKIIEVAPVNLGNTQTSTSPVSPTVAANVKAYKVVIFNGTLTAGLAALTQKKLESNSTQFQVTDKKDAAKSDYASTIVVDIKGNNKDAAEVLAGLVNGKVGTLPSGEKAPTGVDFLVILGSK
jgi:hypothetical protein